MIRAQHHDRIGAAEAHLVLPVEHAGKRLDQRGLFIAQVIGQVPQVARTDGLRGDANHFGERAVDFIADGGCCGAKVFAPGLAQVTMATGDGRAKPDPVADRKHCVAAGVDHLAGKFVPQNRRIAHPCGLLPAIDPYVGAADRGGPDANQHVAGLRYGHCDVVEADFVRSGQDGSFHNCSPSGTYVDTTIPQFTRCWPEFSVYGQNFLAISAIILINPVSLTEYLAH
jgi:hypothetical protein